MGLFNRRQPDPKAAALLQGYEPIGEHLEAGQRALLRSIPTFREDGLPLGLALADFTAHLDEAVRALVQWQAPDELRSRVEESIEKARSEAAKLRMEPAEMVFEALNARVGDILFHLEDVSDLEAELRNSLRRQQGGRASGTFESGM